MKNKIEKVVMSMETIKESIRQLEEKYKQYRKEVERYFSESDVKELVIDDNEEKLLSVKTYDNIQINYDVKKLKAALPYKLYNKCIDRELGVDKEILLRLMNQGKVDKEVVKQFITKTDTVNKDKLERLYEIGEIEAKKILNTYTTRIIKNIKVTRVKR